MTEHPADQKSRRRLALRRARAEAGGGGGRDGDPRGESEAPEQPQVDWLERYRAGDREAFDRMVEEYHHRLVQFFHRLCWDLGRAEDLTQTLFLKLLRNSGNYEAQGKLSTFVFRVATNLWIDHYRSARPGRRMFSLDQALVTGQEPETERVQAPDALASETEEKARLRKALEDLTEPHRIVFELAVYQQLSYREIGTVLDIPVGTVKSRMHNSVRALRDSLAPAGDEDRGDHGFRVSGGTA